MDFRFWIFLWVSINIFGETRVGIATRLYRGHVIVLYPEDGSNSLPLKNSTFFRQNVKNIRHALKTFFIKTIFLFCPPLVLEKVLVKFIP